MRNKDGRFHAFKRTGFLRVTATAVLATSLAAWGTGAAVPAANATSSDTGEEFALEQILTPLGQDKPQMATGDKIEQVGSDAGDEGEIVTIVVQLEKATFSLPDPFQLFGNKNKHSHDQMKAKIQSLVDRAVDDGGMKLMSADGEEAESTQIETVADYYNAIDGFAIKAPKGILADIQQLGGVKNAYVDEVYALPEDQGDQNGVENQDSLTMTGADRVEYRGEGQVIAIIDSGLQTNHEAFKGDLDDAKLAFTQEQIEAAKAGLTSGGEKAKYVSEKIVYCYDYADNDNEVTPGSGTDLSHGTHVAGIAAANGGKIEGTAPDAQIMMLKVCDDFQGAIYNSNLLRAMDDIVAIDAAAEKNGGHGIDSMNMSIGSDNGFTDRASDTFGDALASLEEAGIASNVAAGNSYNAGRGNKSGKNLPYATDPDLGLVSSPATHDGAVAVASVNSSKGSPCFYFGEDYMEYQQLTSQDGSSTAQFSDVADGTYEVVDGGIGSADDAAKVSEANSGSLAGKMVLVQRGGEEDGTPLTFQKKAENYASMSPVAVIIYNNVAELSTNFGLSSGLDVPVIGISLENGQKMIDAIAAGETVKIRTDKDALSPDASFGSYTMSDFSSWGAAPELEIKPEITAPGGNIYSSVTGSATAYSYMSGTSMATPQMAGISAQMTQYIDSDAKFAGMSESEKADLVKELLMSTARPMDEPGDKASYYPVRQQGAGLADVVAATATPVYLTVDGASIANRPKADLGESTEGTWTFSVTLHNKSGQQVSYTPDAHAISDQVADGLFQLDTKDWTGQGISVSYGGAAYDASTNTVNVGANTSAAYTVTIACEDEFKTWAADNTPNGTFVEGFAMLKGASEGAVDLSTPFLGFYGDWDAVPAFDDEYTGKDVHMAGSVVANANTGTPLGVNPFDTSASLAENYTSYIHKDKIVVSDTAWSSSPSKLYPLTGLMRNVKNYKADYKNAAGVSVRNYSFDYLGKAYFNSSYGVIYSEQRAPEAPVFDGKDAEGRALPDGTYTLEKTVTTAGGDNATQTDKVVEFNYDTQKPKVTDVTYSGEGADRTVSFKVTDNTWLAALSFNDPDTGGYFYRRLADDANGDGSARVGEEEEYTVNEDGSRTWEFSIKISDLVETWDSYDTGIQIPNAVNLYCYDYGLTASDLVKIVIKPVKPTGLTVSPEKLTLYEGQEGVFEAAIEPEDATETDMTWTSSDEKVATVSSTGAVHAIGLGTATITATMDSDDTISASATVEVTEVPEDEGIAMRNPEMTLAYGATAEAKALLAPAYEKDPVTWTSSDESIATVEGTTGDATITAGEHTGDATITASVTHGGKTYEAQMKVKVRSDDYGDFVIDEDYEEGPRLLYYAGYRSDVTVPDNVKVIGPQAFAGCGPTTVTVPAGVEKIEYQAFTSMKNLETVYFEDTEENPSQLKELGDEVFYYTLALKEITLPSHVTKIGTGVFKTTTATKVVCPESLREIPAETFYYGSVADVTISDRVTTVGDNAFASNNVSEIKLVGTAGYKEGDPLPTGLPSSLVSVGKYAFSGYGAQEIIMPSGLKTIDNGGFSSTAATKVVLNDGLESVGAVAFGGCQAAEIVIPDSVKHVGNQAFYSMGNCKSFTIGRNIPADELDEAFVGDYSCTEFVVPEDCANYSAIDGVLFNKDATKLVSITEGAQEASGTYTVPDGVEALANYSFYSTKLATVNMPESLKTIGTSAFTAANLTSLVLPDGFETVYNGAFQNCAAIRSLDLGGTKTVKRYAFYANASLSDLNMRSDLNRLETIEEGAFTECASIKELIFPDSLKAIRGMGMINMPALQKVHIGAGLTSSLAGAFTGDPNLREITVSEDNPVYHADQNVLYGIMSEEEDPEYPGKHLFLSLPTNTFSEYTVEDGTVVIDGQAFRNNTSLRKVILPEGLKKLCTGSFNSCSSLTEIVFPDSLEYVTGLYSTSSLKTVDFGTKIKEIEDNAFMGDLPLHIVVRGGQDGKFTDGMDFTGDEHGADTAYFGPGMSDITFSWTETPNILVVPADAKNLNLKAPTPADLPNFYVYVPAGSDGEEAVKTALKKANIGESHIRDYKDLNGTLAIGTPTGDDDGGQDVEVKGYSVGTTWYQTGTDEASSSATYLEDAAYITYAGDGKYRVALSAKPVYASMITDMLYDGKSLEKDGSSFVLELTADQLKARQNVAFKINAGMVMTVDADLEFDQTAVQAMIDDVASNNTGNSANKMELLAEAGAEATITAGGIVTTGQKTDVYVKATGGVVGEREYRFIETSPDGTKLTLQNWSKERTFAWEPVESGATLTAEVRDATKFSVSAAGVMRALNAAGQQNNAALNDLIDALSAIEPGQRTADVFAALQDAIAAAKEVAANNNAKPAQIKSALEALQVAAKAYDEANPATAVDAKWYKEGTYGTDAEEASMVGNMVDDTVLVSGVDEDGNYYVDLTLAEDAATMMNAISFNGAEVAKVNDTTYRLVVSKAAFAKPLNVSFTYTAGPRGQMTHAADLVMDADQIAVATATLAKMPVSWYQVGKDDASQTAGFMNADAQVRFVGGKYLVDVTTNAPEWLTNMRLGETELASPNAGTFRMELTEDQLASRLTVDMYVVPMGNKWVSADAQFDPEAVAAAVEAAKVDAAIDAIAALPAASEVDAKSTEAVKTAQDAYNALSDKAKANVPAGLVEQLDTVGAAYASALVAGLGEEPSAEELAAAREAYDALSDAAAEKVSAKTLQKLTAAEKAADEKAAAGEALKSAIAEAEAIDQANLTNKEKEALASAVEAAKRAAASGDASAADIQAAAQRMAAAVKTAQQAAGKAAYDKDVQAAVDKAMAEKAKADVAAAKAASKATKSTKKAAKKKAVVINVKKVTSKAVKKALKKANNAKATTVTLGKKVKKIAKGAFKGTKVKTVVLKTKKLKKSKVKKCLKGSKVKTVKVKVGSSKANKKYKKKYKKFMTKKAVVGKKGVKVK